MKSLFLMLSLILFQGLATPMYSALEESGAWSTPPSSRHPRLIAAGFKYLAPYTGSAIGQHWMYGGQARANRVRRPLQAEAYRAVSLLLRRPPGVRLPGRRCSSLWQLRLLERCGEFLQRHGCRVADRLPIIETKANDVSAFIPTNVISITDGGCFLEPTCSTPVCVRRVNVGISRLPCGRCGSVKAMSKVAGTLRLNLARSANSRHSPRPAPTSTRHRGEPQPSDRASRLVELPRPQAQ